MKSTEEPSVVSDLSCWVAAFLFLAGLAVLGVRLWRLQVVESADYGDRNEEQSVRVVRTEGVRGRILARDGRVLADNALTISAVCDPESFGKGSWRRTAVAITNVFARLAAATGRPVRHDFAAVSNHLWRSPFHPLTVWNGLSHREEAILSTRADEFPGIRCVETYVRRYPFGALAAHAVGFVGRRAPESAPGEPAFNLAEPEMFGRSGLEAYYDEILHGVPGEVHVRVDALHYAVDERTVAEPRRGLDLRTTLDVDLQRTVERQLAGERGACVALDPRTGEILAFASAPTFDLNSCVPFLTQGTYARLFADDGPQLGKNRASSEGYAPGSVFKPITALAGLSLGYPPSVEYECTGVFELGMMHLRCARTWGHGPLDLRHALMMSCNPYFCNLAMDIGTNALFSAARAFGLASRTGIDLSGREYAGLLPSAELARERNGTIWRRGDLAQASIGQGMVDVTPLQMARVAAALGTGWLVTPHFNAALPPERRPLPFSAADLSVVREGMLMVVNGDGTEAGTGRLAGNDVPALVAGKTGTAEVGSRANRRKNAWFIAYAPATNTPTIAVALVIENGKSGGGTAAPRICEILKAHFGRRSDAR